VRSEPVPSEPRRRVAEAGSDEGKFRRMQAAH